MRAGLRKEGLPAYTWAAVLRLFSRCFCFNIEPHPFSFASFVCLTSSLWLLVPSFSSTDIHCTLVHFFYTCAMCLLKSLFLNSLFLWTHLCISVCLQYTWAHERACCILAQLKILAFCRFSPETCSPPTPWPAACPTYPTFHKIFIIGLVDIIIIITRPSGVSDMSRGLYTSHTLLHSIWHIMAIIIWKKLWIHNSKDSFLQWSFGAN